METEYIKIEVARHEFTDIYLKVPKGWRPKGCDYKLVGKAAQESTMDSDWDKHGWENDVEVLGSKPVEESEARHYTVFDATNLLANASA